MGENRENPQFRSPIRPRASRRAPSTSPAGGSASRPRARAHLGPTPGNSPSSSDALGEPDFPLKQQFMHFLGVMMESITHHITHIV